MNAGGLPARESQSHARAWWGVSQTSDVLCLRLPRMEEAVCQVRKMKESVLKESGGFTEGEDAESRVRISGGGALACINNVVACAWNLITCDLWHWIMLISHCSLMATMVI